MALASVPDISETVDDPADVRIVLIPGLGPASPPVSEWGLCAAEPWRRPLAGFGASTVLCTVAHDVVVDARFDYKRLIEAGERLQERLVEACAPDAGRRSRPLVLVAHSLGGSILKQALCYLKVRANAYLQYSQVLNLVAGVVFVSCPHGLADPPRLRKHAAFLAGICAGGGGTLPPSAAAAAEATFGVLENIHERYAEVGFRFDALSLFESLPSVKKSRLRSKSLLIVDRTMALIDKEPLVALHGNHFSVCSLAGPDGDPDAAVMGRLRSMVESAVGVVQERMQSYDLRASQSRTPSLRTQASVEAMRRAFAEMSAETLSSSLPAERGSPVFINNMDTIFEKFTPTQLQVQLPCFMMDPSFAKNKDFFGRADVLGQLDSALLPDAKAVAPSATPANLSVVVLCGMAGLGKTETAMQFVFTRRERYDAVFWVCAENETKLEADFCRIASELGLQDRSDQPVITKNKVKDWLSKPRRVLNGSDNMAGLEEPEWLLVFDNADSPALLQDYLDIYGRGAILVTSRDPSAKDCHADAVVVELQPFGDGEASQFLNYLTSKTFAQDEDRRIAHHMGGLPLAIAQMAGIIRNNFLTYRELLDSLDVPEEQIELYDMQDGVVNRTARGNMSSIWMIHKLAPDPRLLLEVIACLFPDQIADELLLQQRDKRLIVPMKRPALYRARADLLHLSLIRHNDDKNEIWMHRVPRHVVRAGMDGPAMLRAFSCAVDLVLNAWPEVDFEKRHNKATVPARERLLPHVTSLKEFYERDWDRREEPEIDFKVACLLQEAAWYLYERGNLTRAQPLAELALEITTRSPGPAGGGSAGLRRHRELLSRIYDTLGCIANGTNKPRRSMEYNERFLGLRRAIAAESGDEDFPLAYAHNQMGCAWMMAGDYARGQELFAEALRIWHANPRYAKGLAAMEYANLGLSYWLQGQLDRASAVLEEGLREREEGFGRDNPESFRPGRILHALGNVRAAQERYDESEELHQRAMNLYLAAVGPKYHRVADMCHKLAQHCIRRGDARSLGKAVKLVDQALSVWGADRRTYKPEIARTTFLKSKILYRQSLLLPVSPISSTLEGKKGKGKLPSEGTARREEELEEAEAGEDLRLFDEAAGMYNELVAPEKAKQPGGLTEADFDELIMFWSR